MIKAVYGGYMASLHLAMLCHFQLEQPKSAGLMIGTHSLQLAWHCLVMGS